MPSPFGHALAGVAVAWIADLVAPRPSGMSDVDARRSVAARARVAPQEIQRWRRIRDQSGMTLIAAAVAVSPDFDLLTGSHRTLTHSVGAAALVALAAALIARKLRRPILPITILCGAAYASHILLDWLGKDTSNPGGLMALWPFSTTYYRSGCDLFGEVSRRYWRPHEFVWANLRVVGRELAILGPVVVGLGFARWRRRRVPSMNRRAPIPSGDRQGGSGSWDGPR